MKTLNYETFSYELVEKLRSTKALFSASIELTYGCNLRCVHCYNPTHKALPTESKTSEIYKIIDQLPDLGCLEVLFTGGEPLVHPQAFDIFSYAKNLGLQPIIFTNGTLLSPELMKKLEVLSPSFISVSVYGFTEKTYEKVTGVKGSFKRFKAGLDLLLNSSIRVQYKMPVLQENIHEFEMIKEWFTSRHLLFHYGIDISPRTDGNLSPLNHRLSEKTAAEFRIKHEPEPPCKPEDFDMTRRTRTGKVFDCNCGKVSAAITPYGEMNLCTSLPYPKYSLRTGNLKEGWNVLVDFVENIKPDENFECTKCSVAPACTQGAMDGWLEGNNFSTCIPYYKNIASKVINKTS